VPVGAYPILLYFIVYPDFVELHPTPIWVEECWVGAERHYNLVLALK